MIILKIACMYVWYNTYHKGGPCSDSHLKLAGSVSLQPSVEMSSMHESFIQPEINLSNNSYEHDDLDTPSDNNTKPDLVVVIAFA